MGFLGCVDSANHSEDRHGACSMSEVPSKGIAFGIWCELNFGIFRSVWISEMLNVWFYFIFWLEFVFVVVYGV